MTNVEHLGSLTRDILAILFQQSGALVVLAQCVPLNFVALFFQEQLGPCDHDD
jgi:hypothetical protein